MSPRGSRRLKQIPTLIQVERAHSVRKRQTSERLREALSQLDWAEQIDGETRFAALQAKMPELHAELNSQVSRLNVEQEKRNPQALAPAPRR